MYTIKRTAELVGVSDSTLRAWERRYGLDLSRRTPSGYRVFDDDAVRLLRTMHDLVGAGWSTRAAADEIQRRAHEPAPSLSHDQAIFDEQALARVAGGYDVEGLSTVLDQHFGAASYEAAVDGWLLPALHALGAAWEEGRITVSAEHMVAHGVTRRLARAYDAAGDNRSMPGVVLGLPPGSRHDLGLLTFAIAVRRSGLSTTYLGADVPVDDWVAAVALPSVACAVLAAPMAEDVEALATTVTAIAARSPDLLIAVGGSAQDLAPGHCLRLGHQIGPAAALLAQRLRRAGTAPAP